MVEVRIDTNYLAAGVNVEHRDVLTIMNEAQYVMKNIKGKEEEKLEMQVRLPDGDVKLCTPNQTSILAMMKEWTKDTQAWVGKKVAAKIERREVFGEMKDIIYLVPVKGRPKAATENPTQKEDIPIIEDDDAEPEPTDEDLENAFGKGDGGGVKQQTEGF